MRKYLLLFFALSFILPAFCQEPPDPPIPPPVIIVPNCTLSDPLLNETCTIANFIYTQPSNETLIIQYEGNIEFANNTFNCTDQCGETLMRWDKPAECCKLLINATGNVTIYGVGSSYLPSYFRFASIEILSNATVNLGSQSWLDTTGMGYLQGPGFTSNTTGGSYAAQSGFCADVTAIQLEQTYGYYYMPPSGNLSEQFGSGSGLNTSNGGGRIVVMGRGLQLNGDLRASGFPNYTVIDGSSQPSYGGSGGYVYIGIIGEVTQQKFSIGTIKADGGKGQTSGGSGGRILIDIFSGNYSSQNMTSSSKLTISATGGGFDIATPFPCSFGGSGTIYFRNESKLIINGPNFGNQIPSMLAKTLIHGADPRNLSGDFQNLTFLVVNKSAVVTFNYFNVEDLIIFASVQNIQVVQGSAIMSNTGGLMGFSLQSNSISLSQSSLIDTSKAKTFETLINATTLQVDSSSQIISGQILKIYGDTVYVNGSIGQQVNRQDRNTYQDTTSIQQVVIVTKTLFSLNQPQDPSKMNALTADQLFIYSQGDIVISGLVKPNILLNTCTFNEEAQVFSFVQNQLQLPLSEASLLFNFKSQFNIDPIKNFTIWDLQDALAFNFTYTMIALNNLNITQVTKIQTSKLGAYGATVMIQGQVDTSSKGCQGGQGLGRGKNSNSLCTASGGAYGGRGGMAASHSPNSLIKQKKTPSDPNICHDYQSIPYGGFDSFQVLEGSGGGGVGGSASQSDAGPGGGTIWIQGSTLNMSQAILLANGGQSQDSEGTGVGGGAGGTIFLGMNQLIGKAQISAVGGDASAQGGGGGSGGRIKFYFFSWFDQSMKQNMTVDLNLTTNVAGGPGGSPNQMGEDGTIWSTPCAPGYYGMFCTACPSGTYKTEFSNIDCKVCQSMPLNAFDEKTGQYTEVGYSSPMCPYKCVDGLTTFDQNHKCLGNIALFFDNMGGLSIFIIIVIATIFAISAIIYFLYANKKNETLENDQNLNQLKLAFEELEFVSRDLHQHICRVYLLGENELTSPWILPIVPPPLLRQQIHLERYTEFAKRINQSDKRSKCERFLQNGLPVLYPVLKILYQKYQRRQHYIGFKKAFIAEVNGIDFWKSYEDQCNIEMRFSSTDDYTLGYVDFLDTKRTRDTFDRPPLPMTFMISGSGTFAKPFQINRDDPLVRSINYYWDDKVMWDMFLSNLNSTLLTLCIQNFEFLFRFRMMRLLDFIQDYSKNLFEPKGLKLNLWLLEAKCFKKCGGINNGQSSIYQTTFIDSLDQEEEYYVLSQDYLRKKRDLLHKILSYWKYERSYNKQKVFKLALIITRSEASFVGGEQSNFSPVSPLVAEGLSGKSKPNDSPTRGSPQWKQNDIYPEQLNNNTFNPQTQIQLLIGSIREMHVDNMRVKIFKNYQWGLFRENENYRDTALCAKVTYLSKQGILLPLTLIRSVTLRHSKVVQSFVVPAILYVIFGVIDVTLTAVFLVNNLVPGNNKPQMAVFFSIYPFAGCIAPILGILSMMLCKPFVYRAMAYMNSLALFANVFAYVIAEVSIDKGVTAITQKLSYVWILIFAKIVLAQLLSLQIAYFRNPKFHTYKDKLTELMNAETQRNSEMQLPKQNSMLFNNYHTNEDDASNNMRRIGWNSNNNPGQRTPNTVRQRTVSEVSFVSHGSTD